MHWTLACVKPYRACVIHVQAGTHPDILAHVHRIDVTERHIASTRVQRDLVVMNCLCSLWYMVPVCGAPVFSSHELEG